MITSEDIRRTAIKFFSVTNYLKEGFVVVGGKKMDGETTQWHRLSTAARAVRKETESFDLTQAKSFVCAELGADAASHTEFEKQIYEIWTARTLYSAAHMLADQIRTDSKLVEVSWCSCDDPDCEFSTKKSMMQIYHKETYIDKKKPHRVYSDIFDLIECMRNDMGYLGGLRTLVHDTARKFFRCQAGGGNEDQGRDKKDFIEIPIQLKGYKWEDYRFGKGDSMSSPVDRYGTGPDFSASSIRPQDLDSASLSSGVIVQRSNEVTIRHLLDSRACADATTMCDLEKVKAKANEILSIKYYIRRENGQNPEETLSDQTKTLWSYLKMLSFTPSLTLPPTLGQLKKDLTREYGSPSVAAAEGMIFQLWLTRNVCAIADMLVEQLWADRNLDRDEEERKMFLRILESVSELDPVVDETLQMWCEAMCEVKFLLRKARPEPPVQDDEIEDALVVFREHNWQTFITAEEAGQWDPSTTFSDNDESRDWSSVHSQSTLEGSFHQHLEGAEQASESTGRPPTTQAC
ncbi:hypothetical protein FFLO_05925 [Filobasidium floriforme]|uniref:Uncharacterized protein n=1 Tax=Filobasidium floriforme TaxID=5210 RepID=A0A8K0JGC8_9TREE|nr:uncharacterized protein HD553DRAFT_323593 [Filobasidium floriforme]KAG7528784.1 hypothetical protein FFLO_05925 [Filobasidium floriforme]KAH8085760.1 hypothetical protein HD553DRAFT_323593 [Filobasidium floriforme]